MKLVRRFLLLLGLLYLIFWGSLAAYFSYAESHKALLESNLSSVFNRAVTVGSVRTEWQGLTPHVQINQLYVEGDLANQPALAFDSLSAAVSPASLLRFWPKFTEFAVEKPVLEIVSLPSGQLQIAGVAMSSRDQGPATPKRLLSWVLDQKSAAWHAGELVWRGQVDQLRRYRNISFVYQRKEQVRTVQATLVTSKGPLAFTAQASGDILSDKMWDASLEVLGDKQRRLLRAQDISLAVESGVGMLQLTQLEVERIRDFVRLAGLSREAGWLLDSELNGRLHDVEFEFSGPLLAIEQWELRAAASDVNFRSTDQAPGMNQLSGELLATKDGGLFEFYAEAAEFEWPRWYQNPFLIARATGEFTWRINANGNVTVALIEGEFVDDALNISGLNATCRIDTRGSEINSFGELFTLESVSELSFEGGELVRNSVVPNRRPISLNASADFEVLDVTQLVKYLPLDERLDKFREWSLNAFKSGVLTNGGASYRGELSRNALKVGKAQLDARARFKDAVVDFGYQRDWPAAEQGRGTATVRNDLLSIVPDELWMNGDQVTDAQLQIARLFEPERTLTVRGKTSTSLIKGMDFLFKGPLLEPENRLDELPIVATGGQVDIDASVVIPLQEMQDAKVEGVALVSNGSGLLPENVPITEVNGTVQFTERSVTSSDVTAFFLGGKTRGELITVTEAQPPVMKLLAEGTVVASALEPWVGEHMLTWFDGAAPWQGDLLIDGSAIAINGVSTLEGIEITAPAPLAKPVKDVAAMSLSMVLGGKATLPSLSIDYQEQMQVRFKGNRLAAEPSLFDTSRIGIGADQDAPLAAGINFVVDADQINMDNWLSAIIDLASFTPQNTTENTAFLDAMRSFTLRADKPILLGRPFGALNVSAVSVDGYNWVGTLDGENVKGTLQMQPRAELGKYSFNLTEVDIVEADDEPAEPAPIDYSLQPGDYPAISLTADSFKLAGKNLGKLVFSAKPKGDKWLTEEFSIEQNGIRTSARGSWRNTEEEGSITSFDFNTVIDEAEGALTDMSFDGIIKRGQGSVTGNVNWIGAPHEFEYARLNGEFDLRVRDGELVQVEPGSGKLLGLLNFNAIARRLIFDFRDVFASGLKFDRMRYTGVLADGEAIFREAYIFTPAVFVRMEGKLDLAREQIDMEVHLSPELGGNIALLSALANPTAGAVVFLTQRLFKDEMRDSSYKSYRALGSWEDFEMVEMKAGESEPLSVEPAPTPPSDNLAAQLDVSTATQNTQPLASPPSAVEAEDAASKSVESDTGKEQSASQSEPTVPIREPDS